MKRDQHILVTITILSVPLLLSTQFYTQWMNSLSVSYELRQLNYKTFVDFFLFANSLDCNKHFGAMFVKIGALQEVPQANYTYTSQQLLA